MNAEILKTHGINYEKGLARCMNDEKFYARLLGMFLKDDSFQRAKAAFVRGDNAALFKCLHELKGACGNADLTTLYEAVRPLVELLRHEEGDDAEIRAMFSLVAAAYDEACKGIELALK